MMRELTDHRNGRGPNEHVRLEFEDDPQAQDKGLLRYCRYDLFNKSGGNTWEPVLKLRFYSNRGQKDKPLDPEPLPNGITDEALLAVVLHRLATQRELRTAGREVSIAATKVEEALLWLQRAK